MKIIPNFLCFSYLKDSLSISQDLYEPYQSRKLDKTEKRMWEMATKRSHENSTTYSVQQTLCNIECNVTHIQQQVRTISVQESHLQLFTSSMQKYRNALLYVRTEVLCERSNTHIKQAEKAGILGIKYPMA